MLWTLEVIVLPHTCAVKVTGRMRPAALPFYYKTCENEVVRCLMWGRGTISKSTLPARPLPVPVRVLNLHDNLSLADHSTKTYERRAAQVTVNKARRGRQEMRTEML